MNAISRPRLSVAAVIALVVAAAGVAAAPVQASAAPLGDEIPAGTTIDPTFDPSKPTLVVGSESAASRVVCPDRNFTVAPLFWMNSVLGCNVIGTTDSTKVYYGWAVDGGGSAVVNAKGFNSSRKATWYAAGQGTGRTIAINWGKVAATKQVQGMSTAPGATKIKFS